MESNLTINFQRPNGNNFAILSADKSSDYIIQIHIKYSIVVSSIILYRHSRLVMPITAYVLKYYLASRWYTTVTIYSLSTRERNISLVGNRFLDCRLLIFKTKARVLEFICFAVFADINIGFHYDIFYCFKFLSQNAVSFCRYVLQTLYRYVAEKHKNDLIYWSWNYCYYMIHIAFPCLFEPFEVKCNVSQMKYATAYIFPFLDQNHLWQDAKKLFCAIWHIFICFQYTWCFR